MACMRSGIFRAVDGVLLLSIFLFQSVILNYLIIRHFRVSSLTFLWFLCDFFCLLMFSFTLFVAFRSSYKSRRRDKSLNLSSSNSVNSGRTNSRNSNDSDRELYPVDCFAQMSRLPFSYISWLLYSVILIAKIVILFKARIPQTLPPDTFFGSQMVKLCIGASTIIFSLLVEAHHDCHDEPTRHALIRSMSFGMAMEILDSTSFLGLLAGSKLVYTYNMENLILALASVNLMLPAISLYKLTLPSFGHSESIPLEALYKVLHLVLVNAPYFGIRLYLWQMLGSDVSIFIIKNIYFVLTFFRELIPDTRKLQLYCRNRAKVLRQVPKVIPLAKMNAVSMGGSEKPLQSNREHNRL